MKYTIIRNANCLAMGLAAGIFLFVFLPFADAAGENNEELAKKLANPIASLISLPVQFNYDSNIGASKLGRRSQFNIQPVIPFSLNEEWNIISRTIVPIINQKDIFAGSGKQSGVGDVIQSVFFSPKLPTESGWVWGAGPVILLPTASDKLLGADKWGLGPTAVALKQAGPLTYGFLANHIWSIAGNSARPDLNVTFLQPFFSYTTKTATTFTLQTETSYDWRSSSWIIPLNAQISQVLKVGGQLISIGGGLRYWAKTIPGSPKGLGVRVTLTFLFPK